MGDVTIKGSYVRNPKIDSLSWFEESLLIRLLTLADDGLVDKRPEVIRQQAYPARHNISTKAIEAGLAKLVDVGILVPVEDNENDIPSFTFTSGLYEPKPKIIINNNNNSFDSLYYLSSLGLKHNEDEEDNDTGVHSTRTKDIPVTTVTPYTKDIDGGTNTLDPRQQHDTVQSYVMRNLQFMSPGQLQVLQTYIDEMPEDLIRLAVDKACGGGFSKRNWNYLKSILDNWEECGYKTVAEVEAADEARKARKKQQKARKNGTEYTEMNYDEDW